MSTTIITDMENDDSFGRFNANTLFTEYWMPLMYKHQEIEFIFTKSKNLVKPKTNLKNVKVTPIDRNKAVKYASNETVFLTDRYMIPTYETMILLASLTNKNVCVNPVWEKYCANSDEGNPTSSFSVLQSKFTDTSLDVNQYIEKFQPKVINNTSLYYINI